MLDWQLTTLNPIRIHYKVYIVWNSRKRHFRISCPSTKPNAEESVAGAIRGIREAINDARAQAKMAHPVYLVVPPTATAMRALVMSRDLGRKDPRRARDLVLAGAQLLEEEKAQWRDKRLEEIERNFDVFKKHLTDSLMTLASLKKWMRMRVHLGNLILKQFTNEFANGEQNFYEFVKMMDHPRMQGIFNKRYVKNTTKKYKSAILTDERIGNARTAMRLRDRIINWPERFCPADSRAQHLEEIRYFI